ncbi:protein FAR1-RELATED SEQUENCE 5-like [Papaver somniferum]|uniref:protein FAR1-RELATED SEQUENCE 5-like n=1 Tax=Papaver somniferum TaxID=3469 RepID=UPI000E6F9866|nr:protein FAR1-RELATED SEQUENCE 5-like [Papaver somniferum]
MAKFFWADARSRVDYYHFRDIVCFDPTYCTNRYGMPFVPIVGVNQHYQTTLFGGTLLHSESEESFDWVMRTWMKSMHGRKPKVILTYQESAIGGAIRNIFPGTRHRFCLWHISRLASKHLSHAINKYPAFTADFNKCLYGNETVEEFESGWRLMLNTYKLTDNKWLSNLYKKKGKLASVYTRDVFCADMYTTQRSESINAYFDHFMKRDMPLCEFIIQYEMVITARRQAEIDEDYETKHRKPLLRLFVNIEQEASLIYTKEVFFKFQEQLAQGLHYCQNEISKSGTKSTYQVWRFGHEKKTRTIIYESNDKTIQCSCFLYEFSGYLCRHIFKIFSIVDIQSIPPQYILKRWTVNAKSGSVISDQGEEFVDNPRDTATSHYSKLCQEAINIAIKGSASTEMYNVTKEILDRASKEVDEALKNLPDKSIDEAQNDSSLKVGCVENTPMPRKIPYLIQPLLALKGEPVR